MSDLAIRVEGLSKLYRIGEWESYRTMRDTLVKAATAPYRYLRSRLRTHADAGRRIPHPGNGTPDTWLWALRDVSFEVKRGEVLGIIGRNGAGKSTLLKILSRITEPTGGYGEMHGRVGSLLEVGTGFHPELTGRENVYLNGAIMGMKKAEIARKFDEIVDFSEVEKFIDTPVKRYSSGMFVRLAFAVAAHFEPEILLVDEVLSVGDIQFQRKCLGKMSEVVKLGRTVLFVSHNMGAITRLCKRACWLNDGSIVADDLSPAVVGKFQTEYLAGRAEWRCPPAGDGDVDFAFRRVRALNDEREPTSVFGADERVSVELLYDVGRRLAGCQIGARIYSSEGLVVFYTSDADSTGASALPRERGCFRATFAIPAGFLAPGAYHVFVAAHLPYRHLYEVIEQAVVFHVSPSGSLASLDGRLGVVTPLLRWETRKESAP